MTTPTPSPDVREIAAEAIRTWKHGALVNGAELSSNDLRSVADAVLAAVSPVIRRQSLDEAESAIFQAGLCNEGTPYDSLSGAILVVRGLQLRTAAAAIARTHAHPKEIAEEGK